MDIVFNVLLNYFAYYLLTMDVPDEKEFEGIKGAIRIFKFEGQTTHLTTEKTQKGKQRSTKKPKDRVTRIPLRLFQKCILLKSHSRPSL